MGLGQRPVLIRDKDMEEEAMAVTMAMGFMELFCWKFFLIDDTQTDRQTLGLVELLLRSSKSLFTEFIKSDKLSNKAKYCGGEDLSKSLEETKTVNISLIIG